MVEVFKTNVGEAAEAKRLEAILHRHFPECRVNFDLEDCDKVLKLEGETVKAESVISLVKEKGFYCSILD